jgi:hypothetical protein
MLETRWNGTGRVGRSCLTGEGGMNPFFAKRLIKHDKLRVTGADLLDSRCNEVVRIGERVQSDTPLMPSPVRPGQPRRLSRLVKRKL